jgi:hypothetical protein
MVILAAKQEEPGDNSDCQVGKTSQLIVLQETRQEQHVHMANLSTENQGISHLIAKLQ